MPDAPKETVINPAALHWRESNMMKILNADFLERTGSEHMGARIWKFPPMSANTLHRHVVSEEFYFVLEGVGRIWVDGRTHTIEKQGGIHVWPGQMRQVFNDTDCEVSWLIFGAPEEVISPKGTPDYSKFYPTDPTVLPPELDGAQWPPK